jgi:hypothetical protein
VTQPSLKPIHLRMDRAVEHGNELLREISNFLETNPYEVAHEYDTQPLPNEFPPGPPVIGIHRYRAKVLSEVPDRISILAGDVLKDLRSALDYVAWQMALATTADPPQTTAFPIFAKEKLYLRDRARFIGAIDPAIHPVFDSVQPYHAGDNTLDHPLWVLHRMANDDKHKVPHVVGSLPVSVGSERPSPDVDMFVSSRYGAFDEDDVIASVAFYRGIDPKTEPKMSIAFGVAFGKDTPAKGRPLFPEIDRIGREIDRVIALFEPFF